MIFFLEEDPRPEDEEDQEIIVISPSPTGHPTHSTSFLSYSYGQAIFTPTAIPLTNTITTTTLPTPSFQDFLKNFSLLHFPVHSVLDSSSISLSNPPSYSDSLSSLTTHTSMDRPVSILYSNFTFTKFFSFF